MRRIQWKFVNMTELQTAVQLLKLLLMLNQTNTTAADSYLHNKHKSVRSHMLAVNVNYTESILARWCLLMHNYGKD